MGWLGTSVSSIDFWLHIQFRRSFLSTGVAHSAAGRQIDQHSAARIQMARSMANTTAVTTTAARPAKKQSRACQASPRTSSPRGVLARLACSYAAVFAAAAIRLAFAAAAHRSSFAEDSVAACSRLWPALAATAAASSGTWRCSSLGCPHPDRTDWLFAGVGRPRSREDTSVCLSKSAAVISSTSEPLSYEAPIVLPAQ